MKRSIAAIILISVLVLIGISLWETSWIEAQARRTLYWGSRGSDVVLLQRRLKQWGYYKGIVDGIFGAKTYSAVKFFQRKNGLTPDGIVGSRTWAALGLGGVRTSKVAASGVKGVTNNNDIHLLARIVHAEARAEPYIGQVAVAAVILNRVKSPDFPNTIAGVIYQPLAFESVSNGQFNLPPKDENYRAARDALNGWDPTYGATFFWNPSKPVSKWIWSRKIIVRYGNHVFAR
ncbi:spore cortex-lytic enzyme [Anoxybacter fermentans]|uniref:Spore cortex-lytic enzyme n=1 Tax=Anoxybacter fermentans TaxID=1323375 RepID=A0A3S9T074_9FIRM|nr:spore cortex-lytic enzyme [Anoxybacter fermentans]AZR73822.1 spore cortex-lytic enzyme [Anoxybacter fermentans]